jgi:hypothetical protein
LLLLALVCVVGCEEPKTTSPSQPPSVSTAAIANASGKDLSVTLRLPKSQFTIGEDVPVMIIAYNRGREGLRFSASTSAPYHIRLEESTPLGWEVVKSYPEASAMILSEWTLQPGEKRTIQTKLQVDRDWPTYEDLRLRVHLPGRTDVAPFVHIEVTPEK